TRRCRRRGCLTVFLTTSCRVTHRPCSRPRSGCCINRRINQRVRYRRHTATLRLLCDISIDNLVLTSRLCCISTRLRISTSTANLLLCSLICRNWVHTVCTINCSLARNRTNTSCTSSSGSTSSSQSLCTTKLILELSSRSRCCIHRVAQCRHSTRSTTICCRDIHTSSVCLHSFCYLVTASSTEVHSLTATGRSTVTSCNQVTLTISVDARVTNLLRTRFSQLCRGHIRSSNILTGTHL